MLRSFRPRELDLIARKLGDERAYLYASRDYAAQIEHDIASGLMRDVSEADVIGFDSGPELRLALEGIGLSVTPERF
ncbi:hypothetical protein [Celeribacter sp. ULVN23_4]